MELLLVVFILHCVLQQTTCIYLFIRYIYLFFVQTDTKKTVLSTLTRFVCNRSF